MMEGTHTRHFSRLGLDNLTPDVERVVHAVPHVDDWLVVVAMVDVLGFDERHARHMLGAYSDVAAVSKRTWPKRGA